MDKVMYFSIIIFHFSLVTNEYINQFPQLKRDAPSDVDCTDHLEIINCENNQKEIYRNQDLKIVGKFKSCKKRIYIFDYELIHSKTGAVSKYHNNAGPILNVKRFTLDIGRYTVVMRVHSQKRELSLSTENCVVNIRGAPLFAVIQGGLQRYVRVGKNIVLNGNFSFDYNDEDPHDPNNIKYKWVYFCDGCEKYEVVEKTGPVVNIIGSQHNVECRYIVRLEIQSRWSPTISIALQIIYVKNEAPEIYIRCLRSCISEFLPFMATFEAVCNTKCPANDTMLWNIYITPSDDLSIVSETEKLQLHSSRKGNSFFMLSFERENLPQGKTFILTVGFSTQPQFVASYKLRMMEAYDFSCTLIPYDGIVFETTFHLNCTGKTGASLFWVTVTDPGTKKEIKLVSDSSWKYLYFSIPRVGLISLIYTTYDGTEDYVDWDPNEGHFELTDKKWELEEIENSYNSGNESIRNLMDNYEYGQVLDKMTLISRSIEKANISDIKKLEPRVEELVSDLLKIPLTSDRNLQQAIGIMEGLTNLNTTLNPKLTKKMSGVCRVLSEQHRDMQKELYFETPAEARISETAVRQLLECSAGANRPNISAIEPKEPDIEVTTLDYLVFEGEKNTEVYDAYMDEVESLDNKEQYKTVTGDFVEICYNNGVTLAKRINLAKAVDTLYVRFGNFTIITMKREGDKLAQMNATIFNTKILFPADFNDDNEIFTIILCGTSKNIFWWEKSVEIITNTLIIRVSQNNQEIKQYDDPFEISFKVLTKPTEKFPSKTYSINSLPKDGYESHENKTDLPIYIIALEAEKSLCIEFTVLENNVTLHVISTDFELPTPNHFAGNAQIINQRNKYFVDSHINDYQGFRLISVSPQDSKNGKQLQYQMKAYAVSCVIWNPIQRLWVNSCKAKFSKQHESIVCQCLHLSTITATMKQVEMKEWQTYIPLEKSLEEQYFYEISIFMASLYLLYCIILCFVVREVDHTEKTIYFLSDVVNRSRFGYLIVTKTGNRRDAGTTSNVTIRLIGKKTKSEPHVLNYPDPLLKILQKGNEDWFFLATRSHLGKILEIELWFDAVGSVPSWYCSKVSIFDIQSDNWYEFRISSLFTIYPKPNVYVREKVFNVSRKTSFKKRLTELLENFMADFRIFNLSLRRTDARRSYVKKLTLMFSIVISIGFWCMIFYGIPQGAPMDSIMKYCEFQISWYLALYGIGGAIVTAVFHVPIVHIFMVSRIEIPQDESPHISKRSLITTIICWIVMIILITFYSTFILVYGVWIPSVNAYLWMTSILIGLLFYIFVIEVIASNIMRFMRRKINENEHYVRRKVRKIVNDIETQREILYAMLGKYLLRPFLQHLYRPMQKAKMKYLWIMEKMKYEVRELLENLVMFVIYTTLMYMVVLTNRDFQSVNSNKQILSLMEGTYTKSFPLSSVTSIHDLETYMEKTLIRATQSRRWYGRYAVKDPGMTMDYTNKMLGVVRIRQHRSEAESCEVPEIMRFINRSCNRGYFESQSFMDYGARWSKVDPPPSEGRMKNIWRFTNSSETGTFPFLGKLGFYTGGGYIAFLGRGMRNSNVNLKYLQQYSWFDVLTRGIFIEFLLYNTNFNIFNSVRYTIEKSVTGYLKIKVYVETSRMLQVNEARFAALNILLGFFVTLVAFLSLKTLIRILRTGIWYFKDLWRLIDILLIALSYTCIVLYYRRSHKVGTLLKSLEGIDPRDFVNYFSLLRVDNAFTLTAALLITVATLKLWLLFRFLLVFKILERTFSKSVGSLCAIFTYHVIALTAFAIVGYTLFVDHSYKFAGIMNSVAFLSELNLRSFSPEELHILEHPNFGLGYIFHICYSLTVLSANCIYTAMIIIYYSKAKEELSELPQMYRVKNYVKNQILFHYDLLKIRLKYLRLPGGGTATEKSTPVNPKSDEHKYADCLTLGLDKLRAMSLVSLCVLNNANQRRNPLSQKDIRLMTYTLYYLRKIRNEPEDDEEEIFFKGDLGGNKVKLIPEFQITKIEAATSILLGQSCEETARRLNINRDAIIREEIKQRIEGIKINLSIMADALNKVNIAID